MGILYVASIGDELAAQGIELLGSERCKQDVAFVVPGHRIPRGCALVRTAPDGAPRPGGGVVRVLNPACKDDVPYLLGGDTWGVRARFQILLWKMGVQSRFEKGVFGIPVHLDYLSKVRNAA